MLLLYHISYTKWNSLCLFAKITRFFHSESFAFIRDTFILFFSYENKLNRLKIPYNFTYYNNDNAGNLFM